MTESAFSEWVQGRNLAHLSTNSGSESIAFQGWRPFKEAFAPELVARAISETARDFGRPPRASSDPFGGSGTTALASQFLGVQPTTIEVNPFLADLIETKLYTYQPRKLSFAFEQVLLAVGEYHKIEDPFPGAPATFVEPGVNGRFLFWRPIAERIAAYRSAINRLADKHVRRFFRVMLGCIVVPVSNVVVSGKGRRYRSGWQLKAPVPEVVDELFANISLRAIYEISRYKREVSAYTMLRGDARKLVGKMDVHELSVFSPPYPNSFDYTDVYNVELWTLGYLNSVNGNRVLREATIRSHVQIKRNMIGGESNSLELNKTLLNLRDVRNLLWDKNIPEMVGAYFEDLRNIIKNLREKLCSGGRIYIAVGDSRYAGIVIPVGKILCEETPSLGLKLLECAPFRSMRSSPQQGGRHDLLESLVVMQKP